MRKQTKKILSIIMSAAMALSLGAGVDMTKADAADAGFKFQAGDNKEARLLVFNNWGQYDPYGLEGKDAKDLSISFDVTGVKDTLTAAKLDKMQAFLGVNAADWSINTLGDSAADKTGVIDITEDGSYKVEYSASASFKIGNQIGVMIPDIMPGVEKDADNFITGPIKVSNVKLVIDGTTYGDATAPADPTAAPADPTAAPADPAAIELKGTAGIDCSADGWRSNENSKWEDATINGAGTYSVVTTFDEPVEVGDYMAVRVKELDTVASYITFSDVSVWIDGKSVDMPLHYGGDKDCRIELVNNWGKTPTPACLDGVEFTQVKVQFTIGTRETARDWEVEANDDTLMPIVISDDYEYTYVDPNAPVVTPDPATPTPTVTKNPAKSVKAAKKSVTVKKGKKVNVTFKVKAADNKKKTTDKVKATSSNKKVAKVVKTSVKPGKVVVSVKGVKKGSAKITVKVGSKKATVKVKVKK